MHVILCLCLFIIFIYTIRKIWVWFYENLIGPICLGSSVKLKKMGSWALITGATEGIGKAYTKALAKDGINVILVSRSINKLEIFAKEIEEKYNVETRVIDVDFTGGPEIYQKIEKQIFGLEIGVLINNVGISYPYPDYFLSMANSDQLITHMISCNIVSVVSMCKIVMPQMVERSKGVVINISSLAAQIPNPMLSFYAASKAFVDKFSGDLATEYSKHGIIVQSVLPGFVATNMSKIKKPTWMAPSADKYVASAIKTIGIARHTTGYYPHALLKLVLNTAEMLVPGAAQKTVLKTMENIKSRALRNKQK